MKGCGNPAMGRFKVVTKRGTHYHKWCGSCGFTAHRRRRFVILNDDDGKEYTLFPLQFKSVELVSVLGSTFDGEVAKKSNPFAHIRIPLPKE